MEYYNTILLLLLIFLFPYLYFLLIPNLFKLRDPNNAIKTTPPSPYPYPIIGNILQLIGQNPHQKLDQISKTYGPLMSLKLGSLTTIVISSPEIAKEALTKNDLVFSSREVPDIMTALGHHEASLVWLPVSDRWKALRKLCFSNIFSPQKLDSTKVLHRTKAQQLLNYVNSRCENGLSVDIGRAAFTTVINSLSYLFFSVDFARYDDNDNDNNVITSDFKEIIEEIMVESGKVNVSDFFPILRFLDPQGVRRRGEDFIRRLMGIFEGIIDERMRLRGNNLRVDNNNNGGGDGDLLDSFLDMMEEKDYVELSRNDFLHLLVDLFVAGTDTTTNTIEWAMAELIRQPKIMAKVREELQEVLGKDGIRKPQESLDFTTNLPYLNAIVKETFRLHPPVPLLHHKSNSKAELCGFIVPKDTQVLVNLWAMGRNTSHWGDDADWFVPERFIGSKIDIKGHDFKLMPFGAGRRMCPGLPLAHRSVHFILASLLHGFDWKVEDGQNHGDLDMREKYGLAIRRCQPLRAIPIKGN
ncbi:geraniol 8-hydroxylase-like [Senna tora]|uniref:Geraniol 8-hydroxylase-like n=1 Tax=Senna tora TaxID=362788 RepID=A0A834XFV6_9FABA|nr:geraniol 8-hydroxylase-like [Senna tora]